jgi:hypothetical protein
MGNRTGQLGKQKAVHFFANLSQVVYSGQTNITPDQVPLG